MNWWDYVIKLGSVAGIIGLFYAVQVNRRQVPGFKWIFEGRVISPFVRDGVQYAKWEFQGILKNLAQQHNTVVRLFIAVWSDKKKNSTLSFGHNATEISDIGIGSKQDVSLPLYLGPRESRRLKIVFEAPITGTEHEKLLNELTSRKVGQIELNFPKHNYIFLIEDTAGNMFDFSGAFMSRELIDAWWTLSNYSKQPSRYLSRLVVIRWLLIARFWKRVVAWAGLLK